VWNLGTISFFFQRGGADEVCSSCEGNESYWSEELHFLRHGRLHSRRIRYKMSRQYNVTLDEVLNAWKSVRKSGGTCGYDKTTILDFEKDLDNQIYKIWNRMSSGSYWLSLCF
jgi:hypothetical protein